MSLLVLYNSQIIKSRTSRFVVLSWSPHLYILLLTVCIFKILKPTCYSTFVLLFKVDFKSVLNIIEIILSSNRALVQAREDGLSRSECSVLHFKHNVNLLLANYTLHTYSCFSLYSRQVGSYRHHVHTTSTGTFLLSFWPNQANCVKQLMSLSVCLSISFI